MDCLPHFRLFREQLENKVFHELVNKVEKYDRALFPQRDCRLCMEDISEGEVESALYRIHINRPNAVALHWHRKYLYRLCTSCARPEPTRYILSSIHEQTKGTESKQKLSGQMLLLLLEAGLPYDVAWPITAVTCWLLV